MTIKSLGVGSAPLAPRKNVIDFLTDGVFHRAIYVYTKSDGDYMYQCWSSEIRFWRSCGYILGSEIAEKFESGEYKVLEV